MALMKWWGWGLEGVEFTHEDKPDLKPFIKDKLGLDVGRVNAPPVPFEDLLIPEPRLPDGLRVALASRTVSPPGPEYPRTRCGRFSP